LEDGNAEKKMLDDYLNKTSHGKNLKVLNAFKISRDGESDIFNPNNLGNKKLLFHGSAFSNFVGILSNGMRIAPPEAPRSGYLFGKGVYFADQSGKSANYCRSYLSNGTGVFVMCEVALGKQHQVLAPTHSEYLAPGTHSCMAVGNTRPNPAEHINIDNGTVQVPMG
jgi:hypothetical protein